jgi:hypothetical protein
MIIPELSKQKHPASLRGPYRQAPEGTHLSGSCASACSNPDSGEACREKSCCILRVEFCCNVAFGLCFANAASYDGGDCKCRSIVDIGKVRLATSKLADGVDAEAALGGIGNHAIDHDSDAINGTRAASKCKNMSPRLCADVTAHGRKVDLPLVTEGIVKTLPTDPQRPYEHLGRGALEPMLPKQLDRFCEECTFGLTSTEKWSTHRSLGLTT